ncbi:MAG: dipeptidase [Hydrogenibacillus schlegelii]|nr:dipeptidase [Hydrogenibacillus schlegelii]
MRIADAHVDVLYRLDQAETVSALLDEPPPDLRRWFDGNGSAGEAAGETPPAPSGGRPAPPLGRLHVTRRALRQSGVRLLFAAVYVSPAASERAFEAALRMIDRFYTVVAGGDLVPVGTAADLERALQAEKTALLLTLEGAEPIGTALYRLRILGRLGVRVFAPTHNPANAVADGVGEARGGGLSAFGRAWVFELARLGYGLDVSHLGERAFWDALSLYPHPVIATHSGARAVRDHRRNLTDDQIRAIARSGGVVGVPLVPAFLTDRPDATIDDWLRHVDHMLGLVGPAHVAIGSDFDGIDRTPVGLEDIGDLPKLAQALERRYGSAVAQAVAFDNLVRYARGVLETSDRAAEEADRP